jgi:hypothetical protein
MYTLLYKKIKTNVSLLVGGVVVFLLPFVRRVQGLEGGTAPTPRKIDWALEPPIGARTIQELIVQVTEALVLIMSPVIIIMLIYSGFLFVVSSSIPAKLETAKKTLLYTIIGAAIILGAKGIALAIQATVVQL